MRDAPSNTDDVIDSRDVIARIEELESERADLVETAEEAAAEFAEVEDREHGASCAQRISGAAECDCGKADDTEDAQTAHADAVTALAEWDASDEGQELKILKALADQCEGYGDWSYGETLIRESYFQDYAQELAEDCGMIPKDLGWPCTCIDWEHACRELKMDYTEVDFDGVSYFMRA
jgi:hypothetical protein